MILKKRFLNFKPSVMNILNEDYQPELLHPQELEEIIIESYSFFYKGGVGNKEKKTFKEIYNEAIDILTEKRNFKQFNYL